MWHSVLMIFAADDTSLIYRHNNQKDLEIIGNVQTNKIVQYLKKIFLTVNQMQSISLQMKNLLLISKY